MEVGLDYLKFVKPNLSIYIYCLCQHENITSIKAITVVFIIATFNLFKNENEGYSLLNYISTKSSSHFFVIWFVIFLGGIISIFNWISICLAFWKRGCVILNLRVNLQRGLEIEVVKCAHMCMCEISLVDWMIFT